MQRGALEAQLCLFVHQTPQKVEERPQNNEHAGLTYLSLALLPEAESAPIRTGGCTLQPPLVPTPLDLPVAPR